MEYHRIKKMPDDQDRKSYEASFTLLYNETRSLTYNLARNINPSIFGKSYELQDIVSCFDSKFQQIFNKYYGSFSDEILKGHIINGLKRFKNRLLRSSYAKKNSINQDTIDIMEIYSIESEEFIEVENNTDEDFNKIIPIFKDKLNPLAFQIFIMDHNPPLYIVLRLEGDRIPSKIPNDLICEFFELENTQKTHRMIYKARREYRALITSMSL